MDASTIGCTKATNLGSVPEQLSGNRISELQVAVGRDMM